MKKVFVIMAILSATASIAQTEKGDWLLGGTAGFRTNKNNNDFNFSPNSGYFFLKKFAAGANLQINFSKAGTLKNSTFGIGPFARYYFGNANFRPFTVTQLNFLTATSKANNIKNTTNGVGWLLGLGGAAFLNENVAFEGIAGFNYTKFKNASSNTGFSMNFGFQVYINKSKMASLKKGNISE